MNTRSFSTDMYRFGFNGKENDADYGDQLIQDYGFRLYNPAIGKFLSVDPLAPDYPYYTPYQFAGNTPIQAIDLDGLEPFFIAGTGQGGANWWHWNGTQGVRRAIGDMFGHSGSPENETTPTFHLLDWAGNNSSEIRIAEGWRLAKVINSRRIEGEMLTLVGHSHGGNVAVVATHYLIYEHGVDPKEINLLLFNTPRREDEDTRAFFFPEDPGSNYLFQPPEEVNTYSIEPYTDYVKGAGEIGLLRWGRNPFGISGDNRNADAVVNYVDQYSDWTGVGLGNHLGPTDRNLKEWHAPLELAVEANNNSNEND